MQGNQNDMLFRLKQVLPLRWFGDQTPVLDTLLSGIAWAWAWSYNLLQVVKAQTRISSAQAPWLDAISQDYFGFALQRRTGEPDDCYRTRIKSELVRERGTRHAVHSALLELTGRHPIIFEPANASDTGGYGTINGGATGLGYGVAGGWGSLILPLQCFVIAFRPIGGGIASVSGWCQAVGAYGEGAAEYASLSMMQGRLTDQDIYAAIHRVLPLGTIAWTRISS